MRGTLTYTTTASIQAKNICQAVQSQVSQVVAVHEEVLETLMIAMIARGHALIEGIPGTGKTLLARTLARCFGCDFRRIQFTNDLMPSDIVGSMVWRPGVEKFSFVRGPLFSNLVLADEINRTSPRTLSCLLEAMENGMVSVEGHTLQLGEPFMVMATRNPIEFHGTFPIPEAALDRFLVRTELRYPDQKQELELYRGRDPEAQLAELSPIIEPETLLELMQMVEKIELHEPVADYCYRIVQATREHEAFALGASPRAALAWIKAARARALIQDRSYVLPDDLQALAIPVLAHRLFLKGSGDAGELLTQICAQTPVTL